MSRHDDRAMSEMAHEAALWILREAGDRSLITVTRAELSMRGERMTIFVTVFPEDEARAALAFLDRGKRDFIDHLRQHARMGQLPLIDFALEPNQGGPGGN